MTRLALVIAAALALAGVTPAAAQSQFRHQPGVVIMDIPLSRGADPRYHEQRRRPPNHGRYVYHSDPRFMRGNPAMIHRRPSPPMMMQRGQRHPGMMQSRMGGSMQQGGYARAGGYSRSESHMAFRRSGGRTHCCADNVPAGWSVVR